jgi:hypothetical protein
MWLGKSRCWSVVQSYSYIGEINSYILLYSKMKVTMANINVLHNSKSLSEGFQCYPHAININI